MSAKKRPHLPDSLQAIRVEVNGVPVEMQRVEGGSFVMGATHDQYDPDTYTDKPAHLVFLSSFYVATTEVTNALWHAVMPERETLAPKGYPMNPVAYVSWLDCQEFVRRMDSITGLPFRLLTEAEWEYTARGGTKGNSFRFSGGDVADSVGWTYSSSGNWSHPVARKRPNELGLYDMTGNVSEWCQDYYAPYQLSTRPNPCGPDTGSFRIARGGSYDDCNANSHISVRRWYPPETAVGYIGLRVALTLPDDPMMQFPVKEPALVRSFRIKGNRVKFFYIPAEQPYYISEEVECRLWSKMMQTDSPDRVRNVALGMSKPDRVRFAEYCSRAVQEPVFVASDEQIAVAKQQRIIEDFSMANIDSKRKKRTVLQTQQRRKLTNKLSPWAELIGVRLRQDDDPVLLQYKKADEESRPLRLVIPVFASD